MAIADPIDFLFGLEKLGMKFGLENITRLCEALGHPERAFASVIVAGTNGKGSVTVMVETALRAAGHRTARYTSPHLLRLEERFVIDGNEVTTDALRAAAGRVQAIVERLVADAVLDAPPTFFECTTAAAFELFRDAAVAIAILEVGLGGRLDSTNVVTPIAAAITTIDFDHQAQLGDTIEAIAGEKAGVIKPGIPVVIGPLPAAAERVIGEVAAARGARIVRGAEAVTLTAGSGDGSLDIRTRLREIAGVLPTLRGRHQADNAAVAVALMDELSDLGWSMPDAAVRAGISDAQWPGRLEMFEYHGTKVLIDAAHNPAGARALATYLAETGWTDVALLFAAMRDKDVRGMLEPLAPYCRTIVVTDAPTPRAMPAGELAAIASRLPGLASQVEIVADPSAALSRATSLGRPVVAAGSIFLIGPLRDILR